MKNRGNTLVVIIALVVIIIATSGYIVFGQGKTESPKNPTSEKIVVKTNEEITMSKCLVCHDNLDTFKRLKFDHWPHFRKGFKCSVCHDKWPHQGGVIHLPKMETCLGCHGLKHGKQGQLAPPNCDLCHAKDFDKTPENHSSSFINKDHKISSSGKCLMCHDVNKDCKSCHDSKNIKINYKELKFRAKRPVKQKAPFNTIVLESELKQGTCFKCHFNLDANQVKGLKFKHWPHFKKGVQCKTCHKGKVHVPGKVNIPKMTTCFGCHGLTHNKQGKVAPNNCDTCHTKDMNLKPKWHGKNWIKVHKKKVFKDVTYIKYKTITSITSLSCFQCHEPKTFCQDCHYNKRKQKPAGFLPPKMRKTRHEKAHYQKGKLCDVCHDRGINSSTDKGVNGSTDDKGAFCKKCHDVDMPHAYDWLFKHRPEAKEKREDCYKCHDKTVFCNKCHHSATTETLAPQLKTKLERSNCKKCHDDYFKQSRGKLVAAGQKAAANSKPVLARKYRRLVYHKVHFPRKFKCEECHKKDFVLKEEVFELCDNKGCHPDGQIKPPSGAKLCKQCHTEPHLNKDKAK